MSDEPSISVAEVGGFRIDSNSGASKQEIETALAPPPPPGEKPKDEKPDTSKAASELGKLGAEALAKKRAAEAKEAKKTEKAEKAAAAEAEKTEIKAKDVDSAPEDDDKAKDDEKPLGKPRDDPRARMLEATRKESEAKKERDAAKAEAAVLRAKVEALERGAKPADQPTTAKPSNGAQDDAEPNEENYEDYKSWLKDWTAWQHRQLSTKDRQESERKQRESAIETSLNESIDKLVERVAPIREQLSGEVLGLESSFALMAKNQRDGTNHPETARNWIMNEFLFSPEMDAPALMLYLTEHDDEFQRIATLTTPRAVSRALAKLEARLEAATAGNGSEPEDEISKAAPPVKPVSGATHVADSPGEYRQGMSFEEYLARVERKRQPASR